MICGSPPFDGITDQEIMRVIKTGKYTFHDPIWNEISDECKNFIEFLL
jgi:hypothetical protein